MSTYLQEQGRSMANDIKELAPQLRKSKQRVLLWECARLLNAMADGLQSNTAVLNAALQENSSLKDALAQSAGASMKPEQVIAWATEAQLLEPGYTHGSAVTAQLQRLAELAAAWGAAQEREACALICDRRAAQVDTLARSFEAVVCRDEIRARGKKVTVAAMNQEKP